MKPADHTITRSTSRIPSATCELALMNEVTTFTSGRIGPWTERAIALLRTLESASAACDGFGGIPDGVGDGVLEKQLALSIREAVSYAKQHVFQLALFEKPDAPSQWEKAV